MGAEDGCFSTSGAARIFSVCLSQSVPVSPPPFPKRKSYPKIPKRRPNTEATRQCLNYSQITESVFSKFTKICFLPILAIFNSLNKITNFFQTRVPAFENRLSERSSKLHYSGLLFQPRELAGSHVLPPTRPIAEQFTIPRYVCMGGGGQGHKKLSRVRAKLTYRTVNP